MLGTLRCLREVPVNFCIMDHANSSVGLERPGKGEASLDSLQSKTLNGGKRFFQSEPPGEASSAWLAIFVCRGFRFVNGRYEESWLVPGLITRVRGAPLVSAHGLGDLQGLALVQDVNAFLGKREYTLRLGPCDVYSDKRASGDAHSSHDGWR